MIDYAEEEIPPDLIAGLEEQLASLKSRLERIVESSRRRRGLIEGFRVAIVGKPNVGKSSLLNALLSYERAIVSEIAGTTRDTIEEQVRIGSHIIRLIDTAGIRQTEDRVERIGVERSLLCLEEADIVIALFDLSRPWDEEDEEILQRIRALKEDGRELIVALNKSDLPPKLDADRHLAPFEPIAISARRQFARLMEALERRLDASATDEELMLVSARQIEAVEECAREIDAAVEPLRREELELFSYHIRAATEALSRITRPFENEQILDRMFGEFCLGK
jgi:tRNA modification GTPase